MHHLQRKHCTMNCGQYAPSQPATMHHAQRSVCTIRCGVFNEAVRYFGDLFCVQPFSQTCQIMIAVTVAAFLLDYYDIPSKVVLALPRPVLIVILLGLGIAVLSWIIGLHILDLAKISTFNAMDTGAFVFLTAIPAWFVLQTLLCSFYLVSMKKFV